MKDQTDLFEEAFSKLPAEAQKYFMSEETFSILQGIFSDNQLTGDKPGILSSEASKVMLGFSSQLDFKNNIKTKLNLSDEKAQQISSQVEKKIFNDYIRILELNKKTNNAPIPNNSHQNFTEPKPIIDKPLITIEDTDSHIPNKDELLGMIEDPQKIKQEEPKVKLNSGFEDKLSKIVSLPTEREIINISPENNLPTNYSPKATQPITSFVKPSIDPYREPIN